VSETGAVATPTAVSNLLANAGVVTCDEYLHFLISAFTDPSPALQGWRPDAEFRFPLLFTLKYLLAKVAIQAGDSATFDEIIGAYQHTAFIGDEDDEAFIGAVGRGVEYEVGGRSIASGNKRQPKESLRVMAQISYLHVRGENIIVSLMPEDAQNIFAQMNPVLGPRAIDGDAEIQRIAELFSGGSTSDFFDYPATVVNELIESGFREGSKSKKTHITIERNSGLRREFFQNNPGAVCDVCLMDTSKTYPWADRIMDLHHLLPLSSGTRVEASGTTFSDLVAICPSCHRAVHKYYDNWLRANLRKDFENKAEALFAYSQLKAQFSGIIYA
jgi:hypothetical protein